MLRQCYATLTNASIHSRVLALAIPMVLSNISVPLLGIIDTTIIGHLDQSWYLGGVALGGTMISISLWLLGFLRMSTTGLTAQAQGQQNVHLLAKIFLQGALIALILSCLFLILQSLLVDKVLQLSHASEEVKHYALQYFSIRAWGAPAALLNFVILGWLLGTQNAKAPMMLVIAINLANIGFDLLFVIGLDGKVAGAAWASVTAEYLGLLLGLFFVHRTWHKQNLPNLLVLANTLTQDLWRMLSLNRDIFLRSLCLQIVLSFMMFKSASLGDDIVAANAVLMSFSMLVAYALDGIAYSMEAMVGKAIGAKDKSDLLDSLLGATFWGLMFSLLFCLIFWLCGQWIITQMTDIDSVQATAGVYLAWLVVMPLITVWCFLLDGIFIGATKGAEMRNGMVVAMLCFFIIYKLFAYLGNHGLWLAMLVFMAMRGLTLAWIFARQWQAGRFLPEN